MNQNQINLRFWDLPTIHGNSYVWTHLEVKQDIIKGKYVTALHRLSVADTPLLPYGGLYINKLPWKKDVSKRRKPLDWIVEQDLDTDGSPIGWLDANPCNYPQSAAINAWIGSLLCEPSAMSNDVYNCRVVVLSADIEFKNLHNYPHISDSCRVYIEIIRDIEIGESLCLSYKYSDRIRRRTYIAKPLTEDDLLIMNKYASDDEDVDESTGSESSDAGKYHKFTVRAESLFRKQKETAERVKFSNKCKYLIIGRAHKKQKGLTKLSRFKFTKNSGV